MHMLEYEFRGRNSYKGGGGGGGGGGENCNTPKYTLVVFDMFRVFCKHNLTVSRVKCEKRERETRKFTRLKDNFVIGSKRGLKDMN